MQQERARVREMAHVGVDLRASEGPAGHQALADWYRALPEHDVVAPLPPAIEVVDGVRHVYLRDSREAVFAQFLETARELGIPLEIGVAVVEKRHYADGPVYEVVHGTPQAMTNGGVSNLWQYALGNGTATADQTLTYLTNARAALGVGDSTTAFAATHNDLQAATNKLRKGMEATYPAHTDGTTTAAKTITLRSVFGDSEANFVWNEWAVFNSVTAATGRMIDRKVESLGTKVSGSWTLTITITIG